MRFTLFPLVVAAALTVSAGSAHAQRMMHGGFFPPMASANPSFRMSPFAMHSRPFPHNFVHNPRINPNFNGSPFVRATHIVNPRFRFAPAVIPGLSRTVAVNPNLVRVSPFHQRLVLTPAARNLLTPVTRSPIFISPTFGRNFTTNSGAIALPLAGRAQLASLGLLSFGVPFIPTGGFGTLPFAGQAQLTQLGLLPFGTSFGAGSVVSGSPFGSGSTFGTPWMLW
jgi:hypothetical protein